MQEQIRLTTRGTYAVMAMVELAKAGHDEFDKGLKPTPISDIAERSGVSVSYLEQLIAGLKRKGLVESCRGPGGGYRISKSLDEITITDIFLAAEDSTPAKKNNKLAESKIIECDHTKVLWNGIGEFLHGALRSVSLKDVMVKNINLRSLLG